MKFKVRYIAQVEPREEVIEADDYYQDGDWFVFRRDDMVTTTQAVRVRQATVIRIDTV